MKKLFFLRISNLFLETKNPKQMISMPNFNLKRTSRLFFIVVIFFCIKTAPLKAHEMSPSILDLTLNPNTVELKIRFSVEAMLAEVDLSEISDTNLSKNAEKYDELRGLTPEQIKKIFMFNPVLFKP